MSFVSGVIEAMGEKTMHKGVSKKALARLAHQYSVKLPGEHEEILRITNGLEMFGGYLRLFGCQGNESIDAIKWNYHDYWRFAWGQRCKGFLFFAETAFGDQWAYSVDELKAGRQQVYFLGSNMMKSGVVAGSFVEFLKERCLTVYTKDFALREARKLHGNLPCDVHLVHNPSLLLGGKEEVKNLQKMPARMAMIFNGDIALQVATIPESATIRGIETYKDDKGRMRLKVLRESGPESGGGESGSGYR